MSRLFEKTLHEYMSAPSRNTERNKEVKTEEEHRKESVKKKKKVEDRVDIKLLSFDGKQYRMSVTIIDLA